MYADVPLFTAFTAGAVAVFIAYELALVYIQNGNKKISEMSIEEFTKLFVETYNRIKEIFSSDENKLIKEQMEAYQKATSDFDNSWSVQT